MGTAKKFSGTKSKNGYRWHPKNANNFYWQDQQYLLSYHSIKRLNISDNEKQHFKANVAQSEKGHRCQTGEHVGNQLARSTTGISVNRTKHETKRNPKSYVHRHQKFTVFYQNIQISCIWKSRALASSWKPRMKDLSMNFLNRWFIYSTAKHLKLRKKRHYL